MVGVLQTEYGEIFHALASSSWEADLHEFVESLGKNGNVRTTCFEVRKSKSCNTSHFPTKIMFS